MGRSVVWTVKPEITTVEYQAEIPSTYLKIPSPDPVKAVSDELWAGLQLLVDGEVVPLTRDAVEVAPGHHSLVFTMNLRAILPDAAQRLELSDGNTPDAVPISTTSVQVDSRIIVKDSSLFVWEEGTLVGSQNGRPRRSPGARVTWLDLSVHTDPLTWGHRALQGRLSGLITPQSSRPPSLGERLRHNRTTPAVALGAVIVGGLTGAREQNRPGWSVIAGGLLILALDALLPLGPLRLGFVLACLGLVTTQKTRPLGAMALLASLDCRGLPWLALPLIVGLRLPPKWDRPVRILLAMTALLQGMRVLL